MDTGHVYRFYENMYAPAYDIKKRLDDLPALAHSSIHIRIYGFTDLTLASNLIEAAKQSVKIYILADRTQAAGAQGHKALQLLADASAFLPIYLKIAESPMHRIVHIKQICIDAVDGPMADNSIVGEGSFNFSESAQSQINSFELTNDPGRCLQAIRAFEDEWEHLPQNPEWQLKPTTGPVPEIPSVSYTLDVALDATHAVEAQ